MLQIKIFWLEIANQNQKEVKVIIGASGQGGIGMRSVHLYRRNSNKGHIKGFRPNKAPNEHNFALTYGINKVKSNETGAW